MYAEHLAEYKIDRRNETEEEYNKRLMRFSETNSKIEKFNSMNFTWKLDHNKYSDWYDYEFEEHMNREDEKHEEQIKRQELEL